MKRTQADRVKGKGHHFVLQIPVSNYSQLYSHRKPFCREYYLKYPLEGLLKGICRKLLVNFYELILFGYFLSQVEWRLDHYIYNNLAEVFPNVIHVN
jgi:hypothetical protein